LKGYRSIWRSISAGVLATGTWLATNAASAAQSDYPNRAVTIVVPFSAGGFTDTMSRVLGASLAEKWKIPVVVENRPGAGGNIGATYVARAPADGYTLLVANTATNAINGAMYREMGFDPDKDFAPVAMLARTPNVMVISAGQGISDLQAFLDAARRKGDYFFGSAGNGTTSHLTGVLFGEATGLSGLTHVPFRGSSEVMTALQSGTVQIAFDNIAAWSPLIKGGKVRALAVTGQNRSSLLPAVPTMAEAGVKDVESYSWFGLAAPKGTPKATIQKINATVNEIVSSPEFLAKLPGAEVAPGSPEDFAAFMAAERAKWGGLITKLGVQAN